MSHQTTSGFGAVVQESSSSTMNLQGTSEPSKKKKRKKKEGTKLERKMKREAEQLQELYRPKDSHIFKITPEMMKKMQGDSAKSSSTSQSRLQPIPDLSSKSSAASSKKGAFTLHNSCSPVDFPTLGSSTSSVDSSKRNPLRVSTTSKTKFPVKLRLEQESDWETDAGDDETPMSNAKDSPSQITRDATTTEGNQHEEEKTMKLPQITSKWKPSKKPMVVSMSALIESKKEVSTPLPKIDKIAKKKRPDVLGNAATIGNLLDSSGPGLMNRGKIREKPKPKKPTKLKRAIMKTRALRKANITTKFVSNADTNTAPTNTNAECDFVDEEETFKKSEQPCSSSTIGNMLEHSPEKSLAILQKSEPPIREEENLLVYKQDKPPASGTEDLQSTQVCRFEDKDSRVKIPESRKMLPLKRDESGHNGKIKVGEGDFADKFVKIMEKAELSVKIKAEIPNSVLVQVKSEMHSKKFRPYCDMYTSKQLHGHVIALMKELHRFQDRLYHSDPVKFKIKRRFIHGLKDVSSYLQINKLVLIIIAPDIEQNNEKGGLDDKLGEIIRDAQLKKVPYIFSGNRFILGKPMRIKTAVSAVGIFDPQGAEEYFKTILQEAEKLRSDYLAAFDERVRQCFSG